MNIQLKKVISGGQTGIDQIALELAREYGITTGGWMPPAFLTEYGEKPEMENLYGMQETDGGLWAKRTRYNVRDGDGTLLFGNMRSGGCVSTINFAIKYKKPYCINPNDDELLAFIVDNGIQILNVAGNKQSILTPTDEQMARERLRKLFETITSKRE